MSALVPPDGHEDAEDDWDDTWHANEAWYSDEQVDLEAADSWLIDPQSYVEPPIVRTRLSEFTSFAFYLPKPAKNDAGETIMVTDRFSFEGRRHMYRLYDTPGRKVQLFTSRQCEKSTLICNTSLSRMCLNPGYKVLYVSPSASQTKVFSNDRVKESIDTSPVLRRYTNRNLSLSVFDKKFTNRSSMMLRYAFLNADRVRGISAYELDIDEYQNILPDSVPIIEMCLSHAPQHLKRFTYAGTPLGLENHHEHLRSNLSTQTEWVVPCDRCGMKGMRHWNVLGEKNIGRKSLICSKCGGKLDPMGEGSTWVDMVQYDPDRTPWESYRITQLMVPWVDWKKDIIHHYDNDERAKFFNEVLGLSYDSGTRPLTKAKLREMCKSDISMEQEALRAYRPLSYNQPVFAGIDWGAGTEHSYTVLTLGTYTANNKFRIFFAHRFTGEDMEPDPQIAKIVELLRFFNVKIVGTDYGGGFDRNYRLVKIFGKERIKTFQYLAKSTRGKVALDAQMRPPRWKIARTEVMSDIFNAIKSGKLEFPRWEEWEKPYGTDMLNIVSEYNEKLRMTQYTHGPNNPDDTFHSVLYCVLASMFIFKRPDIIAPDKEGVDGFPKDLPIAPLDQG